MSASAVSPKPAARLLSGFRRPAVRCYLAALAVVIATIAVTGGMLYRERAGVREIKQAGGQVFTRPAGPRWLQSLLGDRWGFEQASNVYLRNAQVTDPLLSRVKAMTRLRHLILEGPLVTDDRLSQLTGLTNLQSLGLACADVTDSGLVHVQGMHELRHLGLEHTFITDAGLSRLKPLSRLETLDLHGTKVTAAGIAELQEALPLLRIRREPATKSDE